jgi:tetratricopeptide (TPR) repeat protein
MAKNNELSIKLDAILKNFINKKKFDIAIDDLLKLIDELGAVDSVVYYLGVCYANTGDLKACVECLEDISYSEELSLIQLIQTNIILGYCYTELKDFYNAEKSFKEALEINPQSSMAYSALGYVYYLNKKYDLALLNFRKALQMDPNNASAHNNLGFTYAEMGSNLSEALNECKKAISLYPKSPAYRDSLGWAYYKMGNYKEAVKELEKALNYPCVSQSLIYEHLNQAIKKRDEPFKV